MALRDKGGERARAPSARSPAGDGTRCPGPSPRRPPDQAPYSPEVAPAENARSAGEKAISAIRRTLESKVADLLRRDPDLAANAAEVGLVDRNWLDHPDRHPIRTATPTEVVQRFVERSVEQRPSLLGKLGLNALQLLSSGVGADDAEGAALTVMFTDLEGFTRYTSDFGDEAAIELLDTHLRAVSPVVRSRGGRIVKHLGDGLMISFPLPEAAVLAALELLDAAPEPLRLRAGLHVGEAHVSRDDVVGHVVNVAARVTQHADGGQALGTVDVRDTVGALPGVRFSRPRRTRLKGLPDPIELCRIESTAR